MKQWITNSVRRTGVTENLSSADLPRQMFWLSALILLWYLVTYVLLPVPVVRQGLDESWRAFLTWAFLHRTQFGTEVIFTYGPWGFLLEPRGTISVYPSQILGRLLFATAGSAGVALLGACWIRSGKLRCLWAAAIVLLAEPPVLMPVLLFFCTMPSGTESRWKKPVLFLIASAAGLAACTKFTCFLLVAALLPLMFMQKGLAGVAATTGASFLFFWFAAGQSLLNIPAFIAESLEIARGYSSAMVFGRPLFELPLILLICALPLLQLAKHILPPVTSGSLASMGWLALCEFLIFRHGIVRNDTFHWYLAFLSVGLPILILMLPMPSHSNNEWSFGRPQAYLIVVLGLLAGTLAFAREAIVKRTDLFLESFSMYPSYSRELLLGRVAGPAVRDVSPTVDVFPSELSYVIEKELPLRNRPVIQAYSAYTRSLTAKNAAFLEGRDAPGRIFFHAYAIDERYPTMEDSLSWRSLLTHYEPSVVTNGYLVLEHRNRPRAYTLTPVLKRSMLTGEALSISEPPGTLIWAELEVERTLPGRLMDILYRTEKMTLRVETDRSTLDFRLLNETSSAGFLLSPLVNSPAAMLDVFQPASKRLTAENVRRISVNRGRVQALGFGRNVKVRLYALTLKAPEADRP